MFTTLRNCLIVLLAASATSVSAFTFQPMFVRLDASGPGSIQTFEVRNESDESLAVRLSVLTRSVGLKGEERNEDAGGLFTIYPARVVVDPRSSAAVKLQWNGPAGLAAERAFRLVAENLALDSGASASSGIKVMFRYIASVYVGDASYTPDLVCVVKGAKGAAGQKGYTVEILNRGKRHVVADSALLTITVAKGSTIELGPRELGALSGANYLPGYPQRLFIPRSEAVPGKTYVARLDYDPEY
jgi:fimbrial chaperone protein